MDNSYFVYGLDRAGVVIERFHICTWEFNDNSSLVEFGCEIDWESIRQDEILNLALYIPWLNSKCLASDLYSKLKEPQNSRFIFNDSISGTDYFDGGGKRSNGVVHKFPSRTICILPVTLKNSGSFTLELNIALAEYHKHFETAEDKPNVYFRFAITPDRSSISTRKKGISKSTIIYDIKVNEMRNVPESIDVSRPCQVNQCFSLNIVPNSYAPVFIDSSGLKNIRTLEYDSFKEYIEDKRVRKDELVVVFNKKKGSDSYSFFSAYSQEKIGSSQIAVAVVLNLVCGVLLFMPSLRNDNIDHNLFNLPPEVYAAAVIGVIAVLSLLIGQRVKPLLVKVGLINGNG